MSETRLFVALIVLGLSSAVANASIIPGFPGDGIVDLYVSFDGPLGDVVINTDGVTINSYILTSYVGIFTGEPANNLGLIVEDTDRQIGGTMGFTLNGEHDLGSVIGERPCGEPVDLYDDLTFSYTIYGVPGTYAGNLITVPEPATLSMLALGGLALLRRRR